MIFFQGPNKMLIQKFILGMLEETSRMLTIPFLSIHDKEEYSDILMIISDKVIFLIHSA